MEETPGLPVLGTVDRSLTPKPNVVRRVVDNGMDGRRVSLHEFSNGNHVLGLISTVVLRELSTPTRVSNDPSQGSHARVRPWHNGTAWWETAEQKEETLVIGNSNIGGIVRVRQGSQGFVGTPGRVLSHDDSRGNGKIVTNHSVVFTINCIGLNDSRRGLSRIELTVVAIVEAQMGVVVFAITGLVPAQVRVRPLATGTTVHLCSEFGHHDLSVVGVGKMVVVITVT